MTNPDNPDNPVRHVVLFRLSATDPAERAAHVATMRERLEALVGVVPGLDALVVRPDIGAEGHWDVVLVSDHASHDALLDYQRHPAHLDVVTWVGTIVDDRAVVDAIV